MRTAACLAAFCLAWASGCGSVPAFIAADAARTAQAPRGPAESAAAAGAPAVSEKPADSGQRPSPAAGRKLIYTADFAVVVPDVPKAMDSALKLALDMGGYLASQSGSTMVIRVPADRFYEAVGRLRQLGSMTGSIAAQDVTEGYLDLETRLANAKALAARMRGLLEKAKDIHEAMVIERELARVQTEIDRLEGQLRLLTNQIAYATITLKFHAAVRELPPALKVKLPFAWLHGLGLERLLRFGGRAVY